MVKTKTRLTLCLVLLSLNIAFIWGNSLLTADLSRAFSRWVGKILALFVSVDGTEEVEGGHHLLRKLAHFTEFTCLGICLSWLVRMLRNGKWEQYVLPLMGGVLVACVDETIQIFVPGRGPGIKDVGIDSLGVILGIVLISLCTSIKIKKWRKIQ